MNRNILYYLPIIGIYYSIEAWWKGVLGNPIDDNLIISGIITGIINGLFFSIIFRFI